MIVRSARHFMYASAHQPLESHSPTSNPLTANRFHTYTLSHLAYLTCSAFSVRSAPPFYVRFCLLLTSPWYVEHQTIFRFRNHWHWLCAFDANTSTTLTNLLISLRSSWLATLLDFAAQLHTNGFTQPSKQKPRSFGLTSQSHQSSCKPVGKISYINCTRNRRGHKRNSTTASTTGRTL